MDESQGVPEECRDMPKVNKYQSISKIYRQILGYYAEVCKDEGIVLGQGNVNVIAFYSPVGWVGKTTLALMTAAKLAMQGRAGYMVLL